MTDEHKATLVAHLTQLGVQSLLTDELWASLSDPRPWTERPSLPAGVQIPPSATWMFWNAGTPVLAMRLSQLQQDAWALNIAVSVYLWGQMSAQDLFHCAHMAGFAVSDVRRDLLRQKARQLRWMRDDAVEHLASALQGGEDEVVAIAKGEISGGSPEARVLAVRLLECLDVPEAVRLSVLREAALSGSSQVREAAQPLVEGRDGHAAWLDKKLTGGSAATREAAAEWAGRTRDVSVVPRLTAAAQKEKVERVLVAQLRALKRFGVAASDVLDRADLSRRLQKAALRGTLPPNYELRDLGQLPSLRWSDGSEVDSALVLAWLKTCHKRRKADPTPMLSVMASGLDPDSAHVFAQVLFDQWVARDSRGVGQWGQVAIKEDTGTANRGLLALVSALGSRSLVGPGRAYLDEHYGWRVAQCKAVLTMLAYLDEPEATQAVLGVATRFRTRGIKKHAQAEVEALAARKGWTPAELADRTLADCGLVDNATVSYTDAGGSVTRTFRLVLQPTLEVQVQDDAGRALKTLPAGRTAEDTDSVKAAKKALRSTKKQVRDFVKAQIIRLQGAMVTQRAWSAELLVDHVLAHPVLATLCRGLVWMDGRGHTFRPAEDNSLVDLDDEVHVLGVDDQVVLAHSLLVDADQQQAWADHLSDYEILQPFEQFTRPVWRPTEAQLEMAAIDAFTNTAVGAFQLRSRARKLGYDPDPSENGGYIDSFSRDFMEIGLVVRFGVEDLRHPIEDVEVRLLEAQVLEGDQVLPLSSVPAVLRSEVYADLSELAELAAKT